MTQAIRSIALLDACVIYPAPIRDLLLHLADQELYFPKWTDQIHQEWTENLIQNRPDLSIGQLESTVSAMQGAFPFANVSDFESLIQTIKLPDPNDAHILAAAIHCGANVIVTSNLKDFPTEYLAQFGIVPQHPDAFISYLIKSNPLMALQAFKNQVSCLRNPSKTSSEVLTIMHKLGLINSVKELEKLSQGF